jgi:hypothetical protein
MGTVHRLNNFMFGFITANKIYYIGCHDNKGMQTFYKNKLDETLTDIKKYPYNEEYINIKGGVIYEKDNNSNINVVE